MLKTISHDTTTPTELFELDPQVEAFNALAYDTPLIQDVLKKYYWQKRNEKTPDDVYLRVARSIANSPMETDSNSAFEAFYELMQKRLWIPGGRIMAGAGTSKHVTLMNCYVNATLDDSIEGIADGKKVLLITSSMGGGLGTDFSPLRPYNAIIERLDSASSGAVSFMDTFNADGKTIRSAGERRAAQMGTLSDTHPDLPDFIKAKGEGLRDGTERLKEFNVSVLVSDAFKAAIADDEEWLLYFSKPPKGSRSQDLIDKDFDDDDNIRQYVYSIWRARDLWSLITQYTYEFSDPGVIYIDRINDWNNLSYCEEIRCTNPCGEQPLPPNGTCNLGAINVANAVRKPFTAGASVDLDLISEVAKWGVRFLDNVIEVTAYPLEAQREEEYAKRRIGLGLMGLGTLFSELCLKYGSYQSVQTATDIMKTICLSAYDESMRLAEERGSFPLFQDIILDCGFIKYQLDDERKERIATTGLRNGVILTIAPTGTGAIAFGCNVSSGIEPDFAHEYERRTRRNNTEEFDTYNEKSYTKRFYEFCTGRPVGDSLLDYMVTAQDLSLLDHIKVQGALQKWVDASISKTINIPADMPYEDFVEVYELAYQYGCKGCTTYRHTHWRDSILTSAKDKAATHPPVVLKVKRPDELQGTTYKVKWPSLSSSMFVTINYHDNHPYEILFASKDAKFQDWMTGLTLMISSILRSGGDPSFIPVELKQVVSTHDTTWYNGKFYGSLLARIGSIIESDFIKHGIIKPQHGQAQIQVQTQAAPFIGNARGSCPRCTIKALVHKEGCITCENCGYSTCS